MNVKIVAVVNAVVISGMAYYMGADLIQTAGVVAAVSIGGGLGIIIGQWLESNGYTMEVDGE